jgi:hypothetical protein
MVLITAICVVVTLIAMKSMHITMAQSTPQRSPQAIMAHGDVHGHGEMQDDAVTPGVETMAITDLYIYVYNISRGTWERASDAALAGLRCDGSIKAIVHSRPLD